MLSAAAKPEPVRLNLGCGMCTPAQWINVDGSWSAWLAKRPRVKSILRKTGMFPTYVTETEWSRDIVVADLRRRLPFADRSADAVYCSHTLEHFHVEDGKRFLREIFRVVRSGGICRVLVPDGADAVARGLVTPLQRADLDRVVPRVTGAAFAAINVGIVAPPRTVVGKMWHLWNDIHFHKYLYDEASLISLFVWAGFVRVQRRRAFESLIPGIEGIESRSRASDGSLCIEGERP